MKCLNCGKETKNPKFCSRSCSAILNNKLYIRHVAKIDVERGCHICGKPVERYRKLCDSCRDTPIKDYPRIKSFRKRTKQKAVEYCGGKCCVCGYSKCVEALEFHHKNPNTKDFSISTNTNKAWNKVKIELDKCILVCSNCHREIHAGLIKL
jgi:hypothetical protein